MHIITRQGTKIGEDKSKGINSSFQKYDYPNPIMKRKTFEDTSQVFKELATQGDKVDQQNTKTNALLQLLSREYAFRRLINLLNFLKEKL